MWHERGYFLNYKVASISLYAEANQRMIVNVELELGSKLRICGPTVALYQHRELDNI
jgi:hypothetical protein